MSTSEPFYDPFRLGQPSTPPTEPRRRTQSRVPALIAAAVLGGVVATGGNALLGAVRSPVPTPPTTAIAAPLIAAAAGPAPAAAAAPAAQAPAPVAQLAQPLTAPANIAGTVFQRVNPSVVTIVVAGQQMGRLQTEGSGTGFVVDQRGYILTNNHVVSGARAVSVHFSSGATREAQVVGTDSGNDLALLKVDLPANTPVAPMGDSDAVEVGEQAIAIGSPFGLEATVTQGIVSAVHRTWAPGNGRVRRNLLQTDAPINPGNSGGPLLNAKGEVIGITSMIESPVRGSVGVGFAIPINTAKTLMPQLESGANLVPVWLGISGQELDEAIARDQNVPVQSGVLIVGVQPNGPAAQAGLRGGQGQNERIPRGGDVITAIDGKPVKDLNDVGDVLAGHKPGDALKVSIVRNGQEQQVTVTLQAWPDGTE